MEPADFPVEPPEPALLVTRAPVLTATPLRRITSAPSGSEPEVPLSAFHSMV